MSKLREQIEVHVRDAMGDIPTPHMLEWHTDVFMQVITDEVERRIAELTKEPTYSELKAEKTEALRPIAKEIVNGLTKER